jgi:phage terminase large subunit-like protein
VKNGGKPPASPTPHVQIAGTYANEVASGKRLAGKWVIAACRRHFADLGRKGASWPYRFDAAKAERVCKFIELLPHTKGKWAVGTPGRVGSNLIKLEPWQCFFVCSIFGWVRKDTDVRRFREAYLEVPRKNGKSLLAAAIGLYMLAADNEPGAEVYSGAVTEKQSWEVFKPARLMALGRPDLLAHYGIAVNASNISIIRNSSKFEPMIGKPGDGASPSCAIVDEFHEHLTPDQYDTMLTGMGARVNPLMLIITTAGDNLAGPCYDKRIDIIKVLDGVTEDDEKFGIVYSIDPEDNWTTEEALIKANPNYGVSVFKEFLLSRQREGVLNARRQGVFQTKHLDIWVQARIAAFNMQRWSECADPTLKLTDFAGRQCYAALDLASKVDIAALMLLFPLDDGRYALFGRFYLPEETIMSAPNDHYRGWQLAGRLTMTDGEIIDYDQIKEDILELATWLEISEVAYDPFQATHLATQLIAEGVPMVEYRQTVLTMSDPMKSLDALILARKLTHDGDPVMTWMMSNVVSRTDRKDNVYPNKERGENKIDGPVAAIMALGRAMNGESNSAGLADFLSSPIIA